MTAIVLIVGCCVVFASDAPEQENKETVPSPAALGKQAPGGRPENGQGIPVDSASKMGPKPDGIKTPEEKVSLPPPVIAVQPLTQSSIQPSIQPPPQSLSQGEDSQETPAGDTSKIESKLKGIKTSGERISLDLKGIDIVELFRILSMKMNLTIVPSKSVTGRVNIFLNSLTFDDALDVILMSQDLACEKKGNIVNIMTSSEYEKLYGRRFNEKRGFKSLKLKYAKPSNVFNALSLVKSDIGKIIADETSGTLLLIDIPEKLDLMEKTVRDLDQPLQTEIFDLKYAKSADIKAQLSGVVTGGAGEVYVDERSSKLVVSDLPDKMKKIRRMVKAFDEASRQVFIEAEIVQITLKDEYQRGINWEEVFNDTMSVAGTFPASPSFTPSPLLTADNLKMTMGVLASDKYTATLQLLQTYGDTKVLSSPRITAVNNQEAKIMVGAREAYVTQTLSQGDTTTVTSESIQFIDVGVKLNVSPTINQEGFVTLKIKPEVSSVRETLKTGLGSIVPIVETSEAETVVKVKDGSMIMIAGLMKDDKREDVTGLPLLSKLPVIGGFFGGKASMRKKTELVIFLTPHIVSGDSMAAGMEPEKWIPPDILTEKMKREIVSRKIQDAGAVPEKKTYKNASGSAKGKSSSEESAMADVELKLKGPKNY